ncbi:hypothetical protein ACN94_07160 [Gordonia paraffinivorans]|nr:hypothetical protein [Gordonia paraffinivorans]
MASVPLTENTYDLPTVVNLRDLGGLPTKSGRTAPGVLLRSDAPYLGDTAPEGFEPAPLHLAVTDPLRRPRRTPPCTLKPEEP